MSLLPGDMIACGTSLGVGSIKDGSTVGISIDGVGSLINTLAPAPGVMAFDASRATV
jgi:2-keto-4-pentenoate hydratase/2-oxohepta-3-ene-1,7-dioic acid hydratase in catechol pathway